MKPKRNKANPMTSLIFVLLRPSSTPSSSTPANFPSSPIPSPLYNNDPLFFHNKEGREVSAHLFFHETIPVYLGRQRKNLFYFKLFSGESIEFCHPIWRRLPKSGNEKTKEGEEKGSRRRHREKMATSLYGNSLSGTVILVTPDLSYKSQYCKEFIRFCGVSAEFHFDSFKEQVAKLKEANIKLNPGDFFITKHSNLNHVNVAFHLIMENANAFLQPDSASFSQDSSAVIGLRNIILTASQCDVHSLVIPAALHEPGMESLAESESLLKSRVDVVNKTIRLALAATGEGGSLKTIQFVLPEQPTNNPDQPLYKKLKSMLTVTNKTQQPAYKI